jgi:High potential iron-sulfur protein
MDCDPGPARRATLRRLSACLVAAAAGGIAVALGAEKESLVCAKPGALSEVEKRQRKLDNYTEQSPDPAKSCSACRFFTPGAEDTACGQCAIFNGPANAKGRCDDWAPRPDPQIDK